MVEQITRDVVVNRIDAHLLDLPKYLGMWPALVQCLFPEKHTVVPQEVVFVLATLIEYYPTFIYIDAVRITCERIAAKNNILLNCDWPSDSSI